MLKYLRRLFGLGETTPPRLTEFAVSSSVIDSELKGLGLSFMYPCLLDYFQEYHYCTKDSWVNAIKHINSAFKFPKYVPARKDCDDFAILFKGLMSACFGLNACGIAIGPTPIGEHAFNMVRGENSWFIIEPQKKDKAQLWPIGGPHGYQPKYILI